MMVHQILLLDNLNVSFYIDFQKRKHHIPFSSHCAHRITDKEFEDNDFIIALDSSNMRRLLSRFGKHDKIRMLLTRDVDDPWYTGDFSTAYRDITEGCLNLLSQLG